MVQANEQRSKPCFLCPTFFLSVQNPCDIPLYWFFKGCLCWCIYYNHIRMGRIICLFLHEKQPARVWNTAQMHIWRCLRWKIVSKRRALYVVAHQKVHQCCVIFPHSPPKRLCGLLVWRSNKGRTISSAQSFNDSWLKVWVVNTNMYWCRRTFQNPLDVQHGFGDNKFLNQN